MPASVNTPSTSTHSRRTLRARSDTFTRLSRQLPCEGVHRQERVRDGDTALVTRVADQYAITLAERVHHAEIDVDEFARVGRRALEQNQLVSDAENALDRLIHFSKRAHARRHDHGPPHPRDVLEQV